MRGEQMTQDEIIEMAKLVVGNYEHAQYWPFFTEELEHFAKLVAAKECEACAKVCEDYTDNDGGKFIDHEGHGYECAAAIRARGEV